VRYLPRPSITRAPFGGESVALVSNSAICLSLITTVISCCTPPHVTSITLTCVNTKIALEFGIPFMTVAAVIAISKSRRSFS
jgi:hypothetical protein